MVKDNKTRLNISNGGCKSFSDVVLRLFDVYNKIKLGFREKKKILKGKEKPEVRKKEK